ncbi:hypothetical protein CGRA01v4_11570 [Colletotrichum graminicola]|nr:hypothetical protein CGRA01v4_11570 [Colletotrichum graminicola]
MPSRNPADPNQVALSQSVSATCARSSKSQEVCYLDQCIQLGYV